MIKGKKNVRGFTLVELAIAVVIIGVLAAFGVPRYLNSVERSKASEAFNYLSSVGVAQELYHSRQGIYADSLSKLDVEMKAPEYFSVGSFVVPASATNFETGWEMTLTRSGASGGYGAYTVVYNHTGYDSGKATIPDDISPMRTN